MHLQEGLRVVGQVGMHPVQYAQFIRMFCEFGKEFADPQAALPMLRELER